MKLEASPVMVCHIGTGVTHDACEVGHVAQVPVRTFREQFQVNKLYVACIQSNTPYEIRNVPAGTLRVKGGCHNDTHLFKGD